MRELKFRAWDKKNKRMEKFFNPVLHGEWNVFMLSDLVYGFEGKDYILMQYTGLKDKNGKEIYEGDVVKHYQKPIETNHIEYYGAQYHLEPHGLRLCDEYKEIEIIGNIHENPKLVE